MKLSRRILIILFCAGIYMPVSFSFFEQSNNQFEFLTPENLSNLEHAIDTIFLREVYNDILNDIHQPLMVAQNDVLTPSFAPTGKLGTPELHSDGGPKNELVNDSFVVPVHHSFSEGGNLSNTAPVAPVVLLPIVEHFADVVLPQVSMKDEIINQIPEIQVADNREYRESTVQEPELLQARLEPFGTFPCPDCYISFPEMHHEMWQAPKPVETEKTIRAVVDEMFNHNESVEDENHGCHGQGARMIPQGLTLEEEIDWYINDGCPDSLDTATMLIKTLPRRQRYYYHRRLINKRRVLEGKPPIEVRLPGEIRIYN